MATSSQSASAPASVTSPIFEVDEPEEVVHHLVFDDPATALEWGHLPGVAFCGHIFTTENGGGISNASLVLGEDCQPCADASMLMQLEYAMETLS